MKLIPASSARWMIRIDSSWSGLPQAPNIIAPRQSGLTWTPVATRGRYSTSRLRPLARARGAAGASPRRARGRRRPARAASRAPSPRRRSRGGRRRPPHGPARPPPAAARGSPRCTRRRSRASPRANSSAWAWPVLGKQRAMSFRHEALFYAGRDDFVRRTAPFLRDAAEAEEPTLVVVEARKIDLLREELDGAADGIAECERHESLLNLAFTGSPSWWLVCPYDPEALDPAVFEEARRTHPYVLEDGVGRPSEDYYGLNRIAAPFDEPLPEPLESAQELPFGAGSLDALRWYVERRGVEAGLDGLRLADLVLAVHELATNSLRHAGGRGTLRVWREPGALICEVSDLGRLDQPLVGRERPLGAQAEGRGLWLVNQLCDLVQIRCFPTGSVVRAHMRLEVSRKY